MPRISADARGEPCPLCDGSGVLDDAPAASEALKRPDDPRDPWFPKPWRVEEDWTAEITAANGEIVAKLPLQRLEEARAIVAAVNRGPDHHGVAEGAQPSDDARAELETLRKEHAALVESFNREQVARVELAVEVERLRAALHEIHKRSCSHPLRTFDDAIRDLDWITDECRRAARMNEMQPHPIAEGAQPSADDVRATCAKDRERARSTAATVGYIVRRGLPSAYEDSVDRIATLIAAVRREEMEQADDGPMCDGTGFAHCCEGDRACPDERPSGERDE